MINEGIKDIKDIHEHRLREIQEFFETYKRLEPHKWVKLKEWRNAEAAFEIVQYAADKFKSKKV
jgi:inorganic pyrophosphatase